MAPAEGLKNREWSLPELSALLDALGPPPEPDFPSLVLPVHDLWPWRWDAAGFLAQLARHRADPGFKPVQAAVLPYI